MSASRKSSNGKSNSSGSDGEKGAKRKREKTSSRRDASHRAGGVEFHAVGSGDDGGARVLVDASEGGSGMERGRGHGKLVVDVGVDLSYNSTYPTPEVGSGHRHQTAAAFPSEQEDSSLSHGAAGTGGSGRG